MCQDLIIIIIVSSIMPVELSSNSGHTTLPTNNNKGGADHESCNESGP